MNSQTSGTGTKDPDGEITTTAQDDAPYSLLSLESRVPEIVEAMTAELLIQVNKYNDAIVRTASYLVSSFLDFQEN